MLTNVPFLEILYMARSNTTGKYKYLLELVTTKIRFMWNKSSSKLLDFAIQESQKSFFIKCISEPFSDCFCCF